MRVAHHQMVVGHTCEVPRLGQECGPFATVAVPDLFASIVPLPPDPDHPPCLEESLNGRGALMAGWCPVTCR